MLSAMGTSRLQQKRRRSASVSSDSSVDSAASVAGSSGSSHRSSSSSLSTPAHKQTRQLSAEVSDCKWTCSLAPTCSAKPQTFPTARELETHYARVHELVCEAPVVGSGPDVKGKGRTKDGCCGCVFPEERFLELHQNEFHNPLLAELAARGDRIYECLLPPTLCDHRSRTPKGRRLHMIDKHLYPKEYFFGVVKVGIGQLLLTQGMGASLLRPSHVTSEKTTGEAPAPTITIEHPSQPSTSRAISTTMPEADTAADDDLNGLASRMAASLAFTPRAVQRKGKMVVK